MDTETGAAAWKIGGGSNGSFLDWWADNGTYVGLALANTCFLASIPAFGVGATYIVILATISIFVAYMNILVIDLIVAQNDCPKGLAALGIMLEVMALMLSFSGSGGVATAAYISFITGGAISGVVGVCKQVL